MIGRSRVPKASRFIRIVAPMVVLLVAFTACARPPTAGGSTSAAPSASVSASATRSASVTPSHTSAPATWQMLSPAPRVLREAAHDGFPVTAVWDGREVLMITKRLAGTPAYCETLGAAYDPASDTWRRVPPLRRVGDCYDPLTWDRAVWDGKEMLIWGTTNAAFNPATNTWRHLPTSPLGWASPAFAVWTGRQMIGWGGGGGDAVIGEGAAYSPATNSWKRLPPAPLAGNGRDTTGAWTGAEVLVAGGEAPGRRGMRFYSDAAAYDPARNTWRRLAPMPRAEYAKTAVWDGTEMLVVDGWGGAAYAPQPGLAYDPATDRWHRMAAMAYPRAGAAIAWTGHELVVWGGILGENTLPPHGETYDPATDTWSPMPRSPLRARYAWQPPIAVWTGTSVVFWGGTDARNGDRLSDGAAFTPATR